MNGEKLDYTWHSGLNNRNKHPMLICANKYLTYCYEEIIQMANNGNLCNTTNPESFVPKEVSEKPNGF